MDINFIVDDYILIWNLLFQASISEKIYDLKQKLWNNYKIQYNNAYKDKNQILHDRRDFIPNDDTIYDIVKETREYGKIKKDVEKYRMSLIKLWDENKKLIDSFITKVIKKKIRNYDILVLDDELNVIDSYCEDDYGVVIIGKKFNSNNPIKILLDVLMEIVKNEINYDSSCGEIGESIIELAVYCELATILTKKSHYISGKSSLADIKRSIYPYWLMYLSVPKDEFVSYMSRDKIVFDYDKMAYEKELRKMSLGEFIEFCYRNRRYIIK